MKRIPDLPKHPLIAIVGRPVSEDAAREIIRRTDSFFAKQERRRGHLAYTPNNGIMWTACTARCKRCRDDLMWARHVAETAKMPDRRSRRRQDVDMLTAWRQANGVFECLELTNSWVSASDVPGGWCPPDGSMQSIMSGFRWPRGDVLLNDASRIAEQFPHIKFTATVLDTAWYPINPTAVWEVHVDDGAVSTRTPRLAERLNPAVAHVYREFVSPRPLQYIPARAIPEAWLDTWKDQFVPAPEDL